VREFTVAPRVDPYPGTLADVVTDAATARPQSVMFRRRVAGTWTDVTAREFATEVDTLAKGLRASGVRTGDRVGIMARTRYEWTLTDFAIWAAGGVTVPIYETSSAEQIAWILGDSAAVAVVVETEQHATLVASVADRLPTLRNTWIIDHGLEKIAETGAGLDDAELTAAREGLTGASDATIIYTSGTTGRPKGCVLTHANFIDLSRNADTVLQQVLGGDDDATLLFLPLAHIFARFIQCLCVVTGTTMGHLADSSKLADVMGEFRPTFILAVPRVFEKVYNAAEAKAEGDGRGNIFRRSAAVATAWSRAHDSGGPGPVLRLQHAVFDRLVYRKLRARLGGRVGFAVSGGGPLGERLGHFFRGVGLVVLEGYGLTETTAPATVNTPDKVKIGTVGKPLPGVGIRIADDGEILIKGVNVLKEYYNNPDATAEALQDGWFRSGDLGSLDDEGFLTITGRKKEIIITSNGKNVVPSQLEDRMRAHPVISQCIVVGDSRPFITALVTLDMEMIPAWLSNRGLPSMTVTEAAQSDAVHAAVQEAVDDANTLVSRAESIRKFVILDTDFTESSGHLTPSLKLKRSVVLTDFESEVDRMYIG
jgi:long-chain acyl-CoA synthetase